MNSSHPRPLPSKLNVSEFEEQAVLNEWMLARDVLFESFNTKAYPELLADNATELDELKHRDQDDIDMASTSTTSSSGTEFIPSPNEETYSRDEPASSHLQSEALENEMLPAQPVTRPARTQLNSAPPIIRKSRIDIEPHTRIESPPRVVMGSPLLPVKVAHQAGEQKDNPRAKQVVIDLRSMSNNPKVSDQIKQLHTIHPELNIKIHDNVTGMTSAYDPALGIPNIFGWPKVVQGPQKFMQPSPLTDMDSIASNLFYSQLSFATQGSASFVAGIQNSSPKPVTYVSDDTTQAKNDSIASETIAIGDIFWGKAMSGQNTKSSATNTASGNANSSHKFPLTDKPVPFTSKLQTSNFAHPSQNLKNKVKAAIRYRKDMGAIDLDRLIMHYDYSKLVSRPNLNRKTQVGNTSASQNPLYYIVRDEDIPYLLIAVHCSLSALYEVGLSTPFEICVSVRDLVETAYQEDRANPTYTNFMMNWNSFVGEYKEEYIMLPACASFAVLDMLEALLIKYSKKPPCSEHLTCAIYHLVGAVWILRRDAGVVEKDLQTLRDRLTDVSNQIPALKAAAQNAKIAEDHAKARLPVLNASNQAYLADVNLWKTREGALRTTNANLVQRQTSHDQEVLSVRQDLRANKDQNIREMEKKNKELDGLKKQISDVTKLLNDTKSEYESSKTKTTEQMEKALARWNKRTLDWQAAKKDRDAFSDEASELRAWKEQHAAAVSNVKGTQLNNVVKENAQLRAGKDELTDAIAQAIKERDGTKNANTNLRSQLLAEEKKRKDVETLLEGREASLKNAQDRLKTAAQNEQHVVKIRVAAALKNHGEDIAHAVDTAVTAVLEKHEAELELLRRSMDRNVDEAVAAAQQKQESDNSRLVSMVVDAALENQRRELGLPPLDMRQEVDRAAIAVVRVRETELEQSVQNERRLLERAMARTVEAQGNEIVRLGKEAHEIRNMHTAEIQNLYQTQEDDIVRLTMEQGEVVDNAVALALQDQKVDIARLTRDLNRAYSLVEMIHYACDDYVGRDD